MTIRILRIHVVCCSLAWLGCGTDPTKTEPSSPDSGVLTRVVTQELTIDDAGISELMEFKIPDHTRSLTITVQGTSDALYGIGAYQLGDGEELVGVALDGSHIKSMETNYFIEQSGHVGGDLFQSARLGTFSHVYPYAPDQKIIPGDARLRFLSTKPNGTVTVSVVMAEDDNASILHVNLVVVSDEDQPEAEAFLEEMQSIFAPSGIEIKVDEAIVKKGTEFSRLTDFTEPQETPESMSAQLALAAQEWVTSSGLNIFLVDALPFGVGGLSLGTPGPPIPDSYYYGVVARLTSKIELGRVVAHEVAHFLALQHVENRGASGTVYPDPLPDTEPGTGNLMEDGIVLTEGQTFALKRSALLTEQ